MFLSIGKIPCLLPQCLQNRRCCVPYFYHQDDILRLNNRQSVTDRCKWQSRCSLHCPGKDCVSRWWEEVVIALKVNACGEETFACREKSSAQRRNSRKVSLCMNFIVSSFFAVNRLGGEGDDCIALMAIALQDDAVVVGAIREIFRTSISVYH